MKLRTDQNGRLSCIQLFAANTLFDAERQADGSIVVRPVTEGDVPLVEPVQTSEGFLMLPRKLDPRIVAAAIRADRETPMKARPQ